MKRLIIGTALLACLGFQSSMEARAPKRYLKKESKVDMSGMQKVFVGWVDLGPDNWAFHRYASKADWQTDIAGANSSFSAAMRAKWLPGRTVTEAKRRGDENIAGQDLYIKFADVWIDFNNYLLYLSIHFIDPTTNTQIAVIPPRPYFGNEWGFRNYLRAALEEVNRKVQVEVTGARMAK